MALRKNALAAPTSRFFDVSLVDTPLRPDRPGETVPAAFKLWSIMVHPAHDGGVRQRQVTLLHHLHQIAVAELETQIPSHAQNDDLSVEVAALEQLIHTQKPGHCSTFSSSERPNMG